MFERFTDEARRIVVIAQEQARFLNHTWIGTEHFYLALLDTQGFAIDEYREELVKVAGKGEKEPMGHIPFTPRAKKGLERGLRVAQSYGHNYINPDHLTLGFIKLREGIGYQVLEEIGLREMLEDTATGRLGELDKDPDPEEPSYEKDVFSRIADALEDIAQSLNVMKVRFK